MPMYFYNSKSKLRMHVLRDFYAVHEGNCGGSSVHRVANLLLMMKLKAKSCGGSARGVLAN